MCVFVVVEGPDGAGKTTFVRRLAKRLKEGGYRVRRTQEPFLPLKSIMEVLPDLTVEELYRLFIIDRAAHVKRVIERFSGDGILISDRYWMSTWVYQGLMGIDEERILRDNLRFPLPDLLVVIMAPPDVLRERIRMRGGLDVIEERVSLEEVVRRYEEVVLLCSERLGIRTVVVRGDGDVEGAVEDVYEEIVKML